MKIETTITHETTIRAMVTIPVEFDTGTGETEIIGDGVITGFEETLRKRDLQHTMYPGDLDRETYKGCLERKLLPYPNPGDVVMLNGKEHVLDLDLHDGETVLDFSPGLIVECLIPKADYDSNRTTVLRRKPTETELDDIQRKLGYPTTSE